VDMTNEFLHLISWYLRFFWKKKRNFIWREKKKLYLCPT